MESGLNDGVCVPLLIIFLTIAEAEEGIGHVEPVKVIAEEIGFGVIGGIAAGALGAWVLRRFEGRGWRRRPGGRSTRWRRRCWPTRWRPRWGEANRPGIPGGSDS